MTEPLPPSSTHMRSWHGDKLYCPEDALHVWQVHLDGPSVDFTGAYNLLSEAEQKRAARFYTPQLRERFIMRRAALRRILSAYSGIAPQDLSFTTINNGKPRAVDVPIHFNLSHSADLAVIGVAQQAIGLDVEHVVPINDLELVAKHHFSANEQRDLFSLALHEQVPAFYRCWTRKEAFIKADGHGLHIPLASFDVTLLPDEAPRVRRIDLPGYHLAQWRLYDLQMPSGVISALASRTHFSRIEHWSL